MHYARTKRERTIEMTKQCPNCATPNRDDARFCSSCATPLVQELICPSCGTRNMQTARFCHQCATPLAGGTYPVGLGTGLLPPNSMLAGRYIIVQKVGQGGMGAVYQATDTRLGHKLVAVKEMSDAAITDPLEKQQARKAFEREAQMLANLNHPNLPRVTDHFSEGGKQYLVMDFIEGRTLEQVLHGAAGFLAEDEVVGWVVQLCDVLAYLHNCQPAVIFRDLKPANIMLDAEGRIKLIDFGVARLFQPGKGKDTQTMGTPGYAAPEQYGTGQTDARSDIYALGVTLHQLLTGYDPSLSPFNLPPARNINHRLSSEVEAVIVKASRVYVSARFQTVKEMKQALLGHVPVSVAPRQAVPAPVIPTAAVLEPEMVRIPAGEFLMGSNEQDKQAVEDENPQHRVYLEEYWIGKYPVTNAQYAAFVNATGHETPEHWEKGRPPQGKENHPVVQVSWHDAVAYCGWLSQVSGKPYRLPTEAEREKAARGTDGRVYPWGNQWDPKRCNSEASGQLGTTPVGAYPQGASPYGLLDVAGNVCEWCQDWYDADYYASSPQRDPQGPRSGSHRVIRGGSWCGSEWYVRAAHRNGADPDFRSDAVGFRCVSQSP